MTTPYLVIKSRVHKVLACLDFGLTRKQDLKRQHTIIPDFRKMGYEFLAFTSMSFAESAPELFDKAREWIKKQPSVIFANNGVGPGMNSMILSLHKNYADYTN